MRYKVIAIFYNKWRIYDIVNDLVFPKNFPNKYQADRYVITHLGSDTIEFHKIKTVIDF
jgi:hypothetical protein